MWSPLPKLSKLQGRWGLNMPMLTLGDFIKSVLSYWSPSYWNYYWILKIIKKYFSNFITMYFRYISKKKFHSMFHLFEISRRMLYMVQEIKICLFSIYCYSFVGTQTKPFVVQLDNNLSVSENLVLNTV
jgi:hypothetical protein